MLDPKLKQNILQAQKNEITECAVYKELAGIVKVKEHAAILEKISQEESKHYEFFRSLTGEEVDRDRFKIFFYVLVSRFLGLNFGLKLMENGEDMAQDNYKRIKEISPGIEKIILDEREHEFALLGLVDEEYLKYISAVVLGLNDALVELTACLAGFTLALQNSRLIGIIGMITGIAASTSMAAAEYLAVKHEESDKSPVKAAVYTGVAYIITVILLVTPFFIFKNIFFSLGLVLSTAILIIFIFTYYISVAKGLDFKKRFWEMAGISLGIALVTFLVGLLVRNVFGISV